MVTIEDRTVVTADGRQLAVQLAGPASAPLVLVHEGTPGRGLLDPAWVAAAVAVGFRTASYSRPGYRWSTPHPGRRVADAAADSAAIADALDAATFLTWGISGGGPHALACVALLPTRVRAAAVLAALAPPRAAGLDWTAGMGQDNINEFAAIEAGEPALRAYLTAERATAIGSDTGEAGGGDGDGGETISSLFSPPDMEYLGDPLHAPTVESITGAIADGIEGWCEDDLAFGSDWGFDLPSGDRVLLVHGGLDLMVPPAHGRWLSAAMPAAEFRFLREQGHVSLLTQFDEVAGWLSDTVSGAGRGTG